MGHKCVFERLDQDKLLFLILTVTWVLILEDDKHTTRLPKTVIDAGNPKPPIFQNA